MVELESAHLHVLREPHTQFGHGGELVRGHNHRHKAEHLNEIVRLVHRHDQAKRSGAGPETGVEDWVAVRHLKIPGILLKMLDDRLKTGWHVHDSSLILFCCTLLDTGTE